MTDEIVEFVPEEPGLGWEPVVGSVATGLRRYFVEEGDLPDDEAASRVLEEARIILGRCREPADDDGARTGLVCGFVQSGKTASMTAISALAKDNGFRILILLAGVTTNLVSQNRSRLEANLRESSRRWSWVMMANPRAGAATEHQLRGLVAEWRETLYEEGDRRTLFITVMKHHGHLTHLASLLQTIGLEGVPTIVFDDEADQASLNTRPQDNNPSSTYRAIANLRAALPHHTYLQYTATPQAPLLITRIDSLSADFAELVSPGDAYTGGRVFFVGQRELIRLIPPDELFGDRHLPDAPPRSLVAALQVFFVGVAAGRVTEHRGHRSMLIHPSQSTATHAHYHRWTNVLVGQWHSVLMELNEPDRPALLAEFREAHTDLSVSVPDLPPFEELARRLPQAVNQTLVTLVNSVDGHEVHWSNSYSHILVGGEKLGRGYTVRGLTVTYMPRSAGGLTADTIQQRARFFGYHDAYLGYCRVFLRQEVLDAYVAYVEHEDDVRARIGEHRGRPLQEWKRAFYLERPLRPTRRNVLSSPYMRPRLSRGWFAPRAPHISPEDGAANRRLLEPLNALEFAPDEEYPQHALALVTLEDLFRQILVPWSYLEERDGVGLCAVNCHIATLLERNPDAECVVFSMVHGGAPRRRELNNSGFIPELFQGRSSAGEGSYPGDRAFTGAPLVTIQVHRLNLIRGAHVWSDVPAIAVRLNRVRDVIVHEE